MSGMTSARRTLGTQRAAALVVLLPVLLLVPSVLLGGCTSGAGRGKDGYFAFRSVSRPGTVLPVADRRRVETWDGHLLAGGRRLTLAGDVGQVQVINWWASWCPPCRIETPQFDTVYRDLRSKGVRFVGVDIKDDRPEVQAFVDDNDVTYPIVFDELGESVRALGNIPAQGPPFTLVVDRHGRVAGVYFGIQSPRDITRAIDTLLAER